MHHELKENPDTTSLNEIMKNQTLVTAHPETSIREAANLMIKNDFQQLPVVSKIQSNKLLGFITLNDVARQQNATDDDDIGVAAHPEIVLKKTDY